MSQTITISPDGTIIGGGVLPLVGIPASIVFSNGTAAVDNAQIITLAAVPSQQVNITLNGQDVTLSVYAKTFSVPARMDIPTEPPVLEQTTCLFIDVYLNGSLLIGGVLCQNNNLIVRNTYFGFQGDFSFVDTQGNEDPQYTGLGTRWLLTYYPNMP